MGFTGGSVEPASAGVQSLVLKIPRRGAAGPERHGFGASALEPGGCSC